MQLISRILREFNNCFPYTFLYSQFHEIRLFYIHIYRFYTVNFTKCLWIQWFLSFLFSSFGESCIFFTAFIILHAKAWCDLLIRACCLVPLVYLTNIFLISIYLVYTYFISILTVVDKPISLTLSWSLIRQTLKNKYLDT